MYDAVIIGAGLAGLQCARTLARGGARVLLIDRKRSPEEHVQTTGIFVRKTLEDFSFPDDCLGAPLRCVSLYAIDTLAATLRSERDEFRVGRMQALYRYFLEDALRAGAVWSPSTDFVELEEDGRFNTLLLRTNGRLWSTRSHFMVGADGSMSRVARALRLDTNREFIVGAESVHRGVTLTGVAQMHCYVDPELAPGYLAWACEDGDEVHVGVGGYVSHFQPRNALQRFRARVEKQFGVKLRDAEPRGGRIPVGGVHRRISSRRGLLIGDAAGAVSPLTAGGLDAAMRLSRYASEVLLEALEAEDARVLDAYSGDALRTRFVSRLAMRRAFSLLRSPLAVRAAMSTLRFAPFARAAEHVFFGRGSFPEPREVITAARHGA